MATGVFPVLLCQLLVCINYQWIVKAADFKFGGYLAVGHGTIGVEKVVSFPQLLNDLFLLLFYHFSADFGLKSLYSLKNRSSKVAVV